MKGIDYAIKKAAADLNISETQAKIVIMEYWEEIYRKLLSGEESAVTIRHVGTIVMAKPKLRIYIINAIRKIRRLRSHDHPNQELIEKVYKKLRLALKHRNTIAIQYALNFGNI